jgi:hypothetical protein
LIDKSDSKSLTVQAIAEKTGLPKVAVEKSIKRLKENRIVIVERHGAPHPTRVRIVKEESMIRYVQINNESYAIRNPSDDYQFIHPRSLPGRFRIDAAHMLERGGAMVPYDHKFHEWICLLNLRCAHVRPVNISNASVDLDGCHWNTARLYRPDQHKIMTGYACASMIWAPHSWLITDEGVIETTTQAYDAYYGSELSGPQVDRFLHLFRQNSWLGAERAYPVCPQAPLSGLQVSPMPDGKRACSVSSTQLP